MSGDRLAANVHVDVRWTDGGIGRFSRGVLPRVLGGGRELGGRFHPSRPGAAVEMAARFAPLGLRGGVLLSPGFAPPFGWERHTVVTVHDLHYLDPAISTQRHEWYFRRVIVSQLRRCRLLLTVSEASAAEIRDVVGPHGPEVVVVGVGVDPVFSDAPARPAPATVPRLLFVGGDKKNKNLPAVLRAFGAVARRSPAELTVVGAVASDVRAAAPDGVSFVGLVDDPCLAALYSSSTALLMPSMAEGFGLPALESLVCGTPVVFGHGGALAEIVGDQGWPVDPFDDESIVAGIESAIGSPIVMSPDQRCALVAAHRWDAVADRVAAAVTAVL